MNISQCPIIIFLLLLLGCDGTSEGTLYNVSAALTTSTCGSGVADAADSWSFQVRLTRDGTTLTWDDVTTGITTQGTIGDGKFSVSDSNTYEVTAMSAGSAGCSVRRHVSYSGTTTIDKNDKLTELEGDIVFKYSQATGYNCDSLIGASDGFDDLPCEVDYTFVATPH